MLRRHGWSRRPRPFDVPSGAGGPPAERVIVSRFCDLRHSLSVLVELILFLYCCPSSVYRVYRGMYSSILLGRHGFVSATCLMILVDVFISLSFSAYSGIHALLYFVISLVVFVSSLFSLLSFI